MPNGHTGATNYLTDVRAIRAAGFTTATSGAIDAMISVTSHYGIAVAMRTNESFQILTSSSPCFITDDERDSSDVPSDCQL